MKVFILRRGAIKTYLAAVLILLAQLIFVAGQVSAATLTSASLTLSDPRTTETSTYTVQASGFTTGTSINCIELDVGTAADGTGDVGLDLSSITLDSHSIVTGSWVDASVDGTSDQLRATLVAGENPAASGNIVWGGVDNGSTENTTYFGVFSTYSNTDCSTGGPVDQVVLAFVFKDGELVTLTIDPTLTFSCNAVGSGAEIYPVGGASETTTVASTASGIDHASTVDSATNGVSAHDLTATTNASGGYNVYVRHTQLLTSGSDTIATGGLTTAAFPAAGTEAWAWTTDDDDVSGGMNDSGSGLWTSFSTTNATIATETGPAGTTTDRVGHQVGVAATTPAGTYTTTIVYTAVATF